jgi:hypothetical protein
MADEADDVDMAMSVVMAPDAQNHDRQDDHMAASAVIPTEPQSDKDSDDDEWVDDDPDAMDLTPDSASPAAPPQESQPQNPSQDSPLLDNSEHSVDGADDASHNETADTNPSATNHHATTPDRSDVTTSDDDYEEEYEEDGWHEIQEDHSAPDEDELKDMKDEFSAQNHAHFESLLDQHHEQPEFRTAGIGRIDWLIDHYNGTRENPNRDLLMKSHIVNVGGYDWQLKFYPRGNESDYLSIYVDCVSLPHENTKTQERDRQKTKASRNSQKNAPTPEEPPPQPRPVEAQSTPFPMMNGKKYPKRESVAANVVVVLYNPTEPRVFHHRTGAHRFCPLSPDWGWTRFTGPFFEIGLRQRYQRQALLRDDKLAMTAYIRVIDDDTECHLEHSTKDNPWDCFAMTGIQGLVGEFGTSRAFVPAVASWLLLKPFRQLIYEAKTRDEDWEHHIRPQPVIAAFQKLLYELRTLPKPDRRENWRKPLTLSTLYAAFKRAGIGHLPLGCDVIEVWELIRCQIERELEGTQLKNRMKEIFGPERSRVAPKDGETQIDTYKVSVKNVNSVQDALNRSKDFLDSSIAPPILHVELDRQDFDSRSRSWKKLLNKVHINEQISCNGASYILYGIITHQDDIQSGNFTTVLRPNGPGTHWLQFIDKKSPAGREEKLVTRLPAKVAVEGHEGVSGRITENRPVAYILLYIRNDIANDQFDATTEPAWTPRPWIERVQRENALTFYREPALAIAEQTADDTKPKSRKAPKKSEKDVKVLAYCMHSISFITSESTNTGIVQVWPFSPAIHKQTHKVTFPMSYTGVDICKMLAPIFGVPDYRRLKLFEMLPYGVDGFPRIEYHGDGRSPFGFIQEGEEVPSKVQRWLWIHVLPEEEWKMHLSKLTEAKKSKAKSASNPITSAEPSSTAGASNSNPSAPISGTGNSTSNPQTQLPDPTNSSNPIEDTIMSESEDPAVPAPSSEPIASIPPFIPPGIAGSIHGNHLSPPPPPPPAAFNLIPAVPAISIPPSLSMPVGLDGLPPPPPPTSALTRHYLDAVRLSHRSSELWFFLKTWDPENQKLTHKGMFQTKDSSRVDHVVNKILGVPKEPHLPLYRQLITHSIEPIKRRKSFEDANIRTGDVVIAQITLLDPDADGASEKLDKILEDGNFASVEAHILAATKDFGWPWRSQMAKAHLDYFGQERYTGSLRNHLPHGFGTKTYFNGDVYSGHFALGQRHGHGRMVYANGDTYEGEWSRNAHHGSGTYIDAATRNTYEGGWRENRRFGRGVTRWEKAEDGEDLCSVCWEAEANTAFFDCGHVVACHGCAKRMDTCPICRKKVLSALRLYFHK